ncbi:sugar ABC transporter ATP-binding protein [Cryptosporangium aurantiacum]|uniref:Monosaccharide ABC transporter ATP-binding protein, CUT2 family n=1 Tax=Cryptosporangium aurantiacum TaxID=134849 RepID=A0A1M7TW48_9ACTN|nr:sugar ABC transporter ATP-binding protein [Cryptosporangium aurantiacum]SHN74951.1 monosaccharide ABC transporter ATP-binding protein, CUT2 family [Cryptosporangium aurantiacum]
MSSVRLGIDNVSKTFGRNRALRNVSLNVHPGEIHALVGQNGSGKSTLAKILTGYHPADPGGRVVVDGAELVLPVRPLEARNRGLAVVHQSLGLVNDHTVVENLRVGRFRASRWSRRIRWDEERAAAAEVLARLGCTVPLDAKVGALGEEDRASVAIARALQDAQSGQGVIIFDESTRSLNRETLEHFYEILDGVVATGTSVLLITHRLEEVTEAADRVTVLRDGVAVEADRPTDGLTEAELVHLLLGRALENLDRPTPPATGERAPIVVSGVSGRLVRPVDLEVRPGEVVGVTGLPDSGYEELPYLLAGVSPAAGGTVRLADTTLDVRRTGPLAAIAAGVVLVPESRDRQGLAFDMSIAENVVLPCMNVRSHGVRPVDRRTEKARVAKWVTELDVRPPVPSLPVGKLSGGNQQKVLLAKWLSTDPQLLLLHEPTQAVDVGARRAIIAAIHDAAARGCAVLVAGCDENELSLLCDRVLVFRDGRVAEELEDKPGADAIVAAIHVSTGRKKLRARSA